MFERPQAQDPDLEAVLRESDALLGKDGPVEMLHLPADFVCERKRMGREIDTYTFTGAGMQFVFQHDYFRDTIVIQEEGLAEPDDYDTQMAEHEAPFVASCEAALRDHLDNRSQDEDTVQQDIAA